MTDETKNKILKYGTCMCGIIMIACSILATYFKVVWKDEYLYEIVYTVGYIAETPMIITGIVLLYRIWRLKQCQR